MSAPIRRYRVARFDHAELKAAARSGRRMIDKAILRLARLDLEADIPSRTRNVECADRWSHD